MMLILLHKKSFKIMIATQAVGTIIENEAGHIYILATVGCWSDFEIIGEY